MIRFVIKDYGRGIPREDFERIFQPFQQTSGRQPDDVISGTGLGLAITRRLVSAMGGSITVDSELGKWSEFTVDLRVPDPPVDIVVISRRLSLCTVVVVGVPEREKKLLTEIFQSFQVLFCMFDTMVDMQQELLEKPNAVSKDRTYACLLHEDEHESNDAPYKALSMLAKTSLFTFGPHFRAESPCHFRSLDKIVPSALMKMLAEKVDDNSQRQENPMSQSMNLAFSEIRVLIAEDNEINQKVLKRMLKRLGIEKIDIANNGQVAVEKEAKNEYDVVLMDQQMPVMGGTQACRLIMQRTQGHAIPRVVFCTAQVSQEFEAECRSAGSSYFLAKPLKIDQVKACLESVLFDRQ